MLNESTCSAAVEMRQTVMKTKTVNEQFMYLLHLKDTITMTEDQDLLIFVGSIKFTCFYQYMLKPSVKSDIVSHNPSDAFPVEQVHYV